MDRYALLIGNDQYSDSRFAPLSAPKSDIDQLGRVLRKTGGYQITPMYNAAERRLSNKIETFLAALQPADHVLLYFSGHGFKSANGDLNLAATDTDQGAPRSTAITGQFLRDCLAECRCKQKIFVIDACYSGAFLTGAKSAASATEAVHAGLAESRGTVVLTSASPLQESWEQESTGTGRPVMSVFTAHLVDGLHTGRADGDRDGKITADELFVYAADKMSRAANQRPMRSDFDVQGEIVIGYTRPRPYRHIPSSVPPLPRPLPRLLDEFPANARVCWQAAQKRWESLPSWARLLCAAVAIPVVLASAVLLAAVLVSFTVVYVSLRLWDRDPRLLIGTAIVSALLLSALGSALFSEPPAPRLSCDYTWSLAGSGTGPTSVPIATARHEYRAVMHTTLGDISIESLASQYPCGAYALRYLMEHHFYDNIQCEHFDEATSGYILDCLDSTQSFPSVGVSFSPDDTSIPTASDGLILLNVSQNQAQGFMAFSGNSPVMLYKSYQPCAQITQGLNIIRAVANAARPYGPLIVVGTMPKPIVIKSITILTTPSSSP